MGARWITHHVSMDDGVLEERSGSIDGGKNAYAVQMWELAHDGVPHVCGVILSCADHVVSFGESNIKCSCFLVFNLCMKQKKNLFFFLSKLFDRLGHYRTTSSFGCMAFA